MINKLKKFPYVFSLTTGFCWAVVYIFYLIYAAKYTEIREWKAFVFPVIIPLVIGMFFGGFLDENINLSGGMLAVCMVVLNVSMSIAGMAYTIEQQPINRLEKAFAKENIQLIPTGHVFTQNMVFIKHGRWVDTVYKNEENKAIILVRSNDKFYKTTYDMNDPEFQRQLGNGNIKFIEICRPTDIGGYMPDPAHVPDAELTCSGKWIQDRSPSELSEYLHKYYYKQHEFIKIFNATLEEN